MTTIGVICIFVLLTITSAFSDSGNNASDYPSFLVVKTSTGKVRGGLGGVTIGKKDTIYRFRSIPFAEPPVGELRFEPPVPKKPWSGTLDVSKPGAICIQGSNPVQGSEDCLFLKIYTTKIPSKINKLPVMVWIYGGAFFAGAPDFKSHALDHLLDEGVILASFHYRVGALGFLSTGDLVLPGNLGLKDQILALKWIKANIRNFGGDPDKITIFGQSAGSASISYLLLSNKTRGLYSGAILQSGNALDQWALDRNPLDFAKVVAKDLKVSTRSSQAILDGLKKIPVEELQTTAVSKYAAYLITNDNPLHGLPMAPVIEPDHDGAVVTGSSYQKLEDGQFQQVPILIGHTSNEPLLTSLSGIFRLFLGLYDTLPSRLIPISMNVNSIGRQILGTNIKVHYFGMSLIAASAVKFMKFLHDDQFERGIHEATRLYSQRVPTYYYEFAHEGSLFGVTNRTYSGVGHNEDLGYMFDFGYVGSEADYNVRKQVVKLWTNFAKTGNPTSKADLDLDKVIWPVYSSGEDINKLVINNGLAIQTNWESNHPYWRNIFRRYGRRPFLTF